MEYDMGHKDGALHFDIMDIMQGNAPDLSKDEEIVLYCESGNRAMMAKSMLEDMGFKNVVNCGGLDEVS